MKRLLPILFLLLIVSMACSGLQNPTPARSSPPPPAAADTAVMRPTAAVQTPSATAPLDLPTESEDSQVLPQRQSKPGDLARAHLEVLGEEIGQRPVNSDGETRAAEYIETAFKKMGYTPKLQVFTQDSEDGEEVTGANIIANKTGQSDRWIVVGAHYDSIDVGHGVDDNASGVAVMLEAAERVKDLPTPYSIHFVAFASEELGLIGSDYYVSQMSPSEIKKTAAMINLDSLAAGNFCYIYGSEGDAGRIRDWTLQEAARQGLDLITQSGDNPQFPADTTGDFSDHAAFRRAGIQYAYFEATDWTLGELDGYTQVDPQYGEEGEIWHTRYDTLEYIEKTFPGRLDAHLNLFSSLLFQILTQYQD